jgi:two-component system, OmpR family, response regulator MprA
MRVLIVDDEDMVRVSLRRVLESEGFEVSEASNGEAALGCVAEVRPDLIVLDILMPGMDGIEVCRRLRADPFTAKLPILFLTAKGRREDVARGLDAGGDDYLIKPLDVVELPARVRAMLRRAPGGSLDTQSEFLTVGSVQLHATRSEAIVSGVTVELTPVEHRLLHYLMLHAGRPVSTDMLLEDVWEYPPGVGNPKLVQTHIANLRAKIEPEPDNPQYIINIRGRGYLIAAAAESLK